MKSKTNQIIFLDTKLLPIYGFNSIYDYKTKISENDLSKDSHLLTKLNLIINDFKKYFPIKNFSLHKTNNKITSVKHAISFLKRCLIITIVPFEFATIKGIKWLRLIPQNNILTNYINNKKMSEIRYLKTENESLNDSCLSDYGKMVGPISIKYDEILNSVKKTINKTIYVPFINHYNKGKLELSSRDLSFYYENLSSIKITLTSKLVSDDVIKKYLEGKQYSIVISRTQILYKGAYKFDANLIPYDIILFGPLSKYSEISIEFDNFELFDIVKDLVLIKIDYDVKHFNPSVKNIIEKNNVIINIPLPDLNQSNKLNYLMYANGCLKLMYQNYQNINYDKQINFSEYGNEFEIITTSKQFKCFNINNNNIEYITPLILQYDLVKVENIVNNKDIIEYFLQIENYIDVYCRLVNNNAYHRKIPNCDALSDVSVKFNSSINFDNIHFFITNGKKTEHLNHIFEDNNFKIKLNEMEHINNLANDITYFAFKIFKNNISIEDLFQQLKNIQINMSGWYYCTQYRKQLDNNNLIINLSNLK